MKHVQSVIYSVLLVFVCSGALFGQNGTRATIAWEVQKYDITATLPGNEAGRILDVRALLTLKGIRDSTGTRLTLRISDRAEVSSVKVNGATADFEKGVEKISDFQNLQRVIVRLPAIAPQAVFSVEVNYRLTIRENTGLSAISPVGSQFLPLSFWYPTPTSWYFAGGPDYAPFQITVNNKFKKMFVSSGIRTGETYSQKLFAQPFFLTGDWSVSDTAAKNGVEVYLPTGIGSDGNKRDRELAELAREARDFTRDLLGEAPDVPVRIVGVKRGAGFSSGGTILIDDNVFLRQKIDSQTVQTIAEGVAKIWLGNAVRVSGDGYGVIREGLSRYIATEFIEHKYGREIADVERLRQRVSYAAVASRDAPLRIASPLDDYYYTSVANKGAMIWRLLAKRLGRREFFEIIRLQMAAGELDLNRLRSALAAEKDFLDYAIDEVTEMNLMIGLPQITGSNARVALRNTGKIDVEVDVTAYLEGGEKITKQVNIPAKSFGEVVFANAARIKRMEIDSENLYPQTNYADDTAPRQLDETDEILAVKRAFDRQDFATAEKNARIILQDRVRFDDARTWLARSLLAQGKTAEAEKEFRTVLGETLPSARSLAWANVGLGEIALKNGQKAQALTHFEEAIRTDAEYGANLAARRGREKTGLSKPFSESIKSFFARFDKSALSGRREEIDALIIAGEMADFARNVPGQAEKWNTTVVQVDRVDENNILVETRLNIQLIEKSEESGLAVFHLTRIGDEWKLNGVRMFEVR